MLNEFIKRDREANPLTIAVVGDSMLDEYYNVSVDRISPEYPIAVMHSDSFAHDTYPGGAANVCYQFSNFNVEARLFSFLDPVAEHIFKDIYNLNIISSIVDDRVSVPVKRRFYQNQYPLTRWDIEKNFYGLDRDVLEKHQQSLISRLKNLPFDIIIFSDYNKGLFYEAEMEFCRANIDPIILVDPKKGPIERKWIGSPKDIIKPNSVEAHELTKCQDVESQLISLNTLTGMCPVITKGGDGVYWRENCEINSFVSTKVIPKSVIGAGDCFMAFLAMARGREFTLAESIEIAYQASSKYVQGRYNNPLYPIDLIKEKYISPTDLKKRNFSLVFTNGCFDLLHYGHLATLEFAKTKGDKLVVAINSDSSVKKIKGESRPILTLEERIKALAALEVVDYIVSFEEENPEKIIKIIEPDYLVKGGDYSVDQIIGAKYVKEVYLAPYIEGISTTSIINRIS